MFEYFCFSDSILQLKSKDVCRVFFQKFMRDQVIMKNSNYIDVFETVRIISFHKNPCLKI